MSIGFAGGRIIGAGFEAGIGLIPGVELMFAFLVKVQGGCEGANGCCCCVQGSTFWSVFGLSRALASASSFSFGLRGRDLTTTPTVLPTESD